jgi:hypothetical protein
VGKSIHEPDIRPMKGTAEMSRLASTTDSPTPRSRRRLAAWLAFGAVGLATGAVWASGFSTVTPTNGTTDGSPALAKVAPASPASELTGKVTTVDALNFDWAGRWGSISDPVTLFEVDLSGLDPLRTYNVAFLLAETPAPAGWASLQLLVERVDKASGGSCVAADFNGSNNAEVLDADDQDAGIYWNGLAGDAVYCIGIADSTGDDPAGTFLRSGQDTPPTVLPRFITTVERAS